MARSQIIKDLAVGKKDVFTALKILKVILSDLDLPAIASWVEHELSGYSLEDQFPDYRAVKGIIMGSFWVGYMQYKNLPMPLSQVDTDIVEELSSIRIPQSIKAIADILLQDDKDIKFTRILPSNAYPFFMRGTNIDGIITLETVLDKSALPNVLAAVENRLLDTFILLEKKLGNLDELDFSIDEIQQEELRRQIQNIIFNDNSIKIGDNNRIDSSTIKTGI